MQVQSLGTWGELNIGGPGGPTDCCTANGVVGKRVQRSGIDRTVETACASPTLPRLADEDRPSRSHVDGRTAGSQESKVREMDRMDDVTFRAVVPLRRGGQKHLDQGLEGTRFRFPLCCGVPCR